MPRAVASRKPALAVAAIAALLAVPLAYAIARVVQERISPEPDPALVVWSTRTGMYWRVAIGAYVGAMIAPLAYAWARRDLERATRAILVAVPVVALAIAAQGVLFP